MDQEVNTPQQREEDRRQIQDFGSALVKNEQGAIYTLTIIGQVEGHQILPETVKSTKYEHVLPLLASIEESPEIDGLLILLNTVGGDIEAGLAISEMIAGMRKPTVSLVLGGGHSIGIPLAVSARRCMIAPTASMTIHPVRISGTVIGAPQSFYYFEQMQNRIIRFITEHSRVDEETFRSLLMRTDQIATDVGSIVEGTEAKKIGLIDETGGVSDALAALRDMIRESRK